LEVTYPPVSHDDHKKRGDRVEQLLCAEMDSVFQVFGVEDIVDLILDYLWDEWINEKWESQGLTYLSEQINNKLDKLIADAKDWGRVQRLN
jgi:hypothetical protein